MKIFLGVFPRSMHQSCLSIKYANGYGFINQGLESSVLRFSGGIGFVVF